MKPSQLAQTLQSVLSPYQNRKRWVVALSGGLDSTVLLHALAKLERRPELCALHIHHGLQAEADQWQRHCAALCGELGVAFASRNVSVTTGSGPESAARDARYQAFSEFLGQGDVLLQAHHQDDQVETVFLRLLRGTGLDGMQGIPAYRTLGEAELLRPLLSLPRAALELYAREQKLQWVEDPSNADSRFDRNYLRQQVLPLIEARWPGYRETVARFSRHASEAAADRKPVADGLIESPDSMYPIVALDALKALAEPDRKALLREWLTACKLQPGEAQLAAIQRDLVFSSGDAEPLIELQGYQLRRYQQRLYITRLAPCDPDFQQHWDFKEPLHIPGAGRLRAEACDPGMGLQAESVVVRLRQGGERCRPRGRKHSQSLKKLLQEHHIAPWRRDRLPLLYVGDQLAAVADLWVCEGFAAPAQGKAGGTPTWHLYWSPQE